MHKPRSIPSASSRSATEARHEECNLNGTVIVSGKVNSESKYEEK